MLFWDFTQPRVVIAYRRFRSTNRPHLQGVKPKRRSGITTLLCVKFHNIAGLIYIAAETWNNLAKLVNPRNVAKKSAGGVGLVTSAFHGLASAYRVESLYHRMSLVVAFWRLHWVSLRLHDGLERFGYCALVHTVGLGCITWKCCAKVFSC